MFSKAFQPLSFNHHLFFRPSPVLNLGDEEIGGGMVDKAVIKDAASSSNQQDPLDSYFGI